MSFRARLTLVAAVAVAVVVVVLAPATYLVVRSQLYRQIDRTLETRAAVLQRLPLEIDHGYLIVPGPGLDVGYTWVQAYDSTGDRSYRPPGPQSVTVPVSSGVRAAASGKGKRHFENGTVNDVPVRQLVIPLNNGYALQVMRPIAETQSALHRIRNLLIGLALAGIAGAAGLGLLVARTALAPVRRMTDTAERVTETRDLTERIAVEGRDELSRLGGAFNEMMGALEDSARIQRQLVADASHELRTPLTSLRTNIEVLALDRAMPDGERARLLHDVVEQLEEMTTLVAELVELARGEHQTGEPEDVRLDLLVDEAVERARRNAPAVRFETDLHEATVRGVPQQLERAVTNLLDNAAKWSPPGGVVDVRVADGEVTIRDRGPGIDPVDLPHVFDRFYRAPPARGLPGSGLGLAIVRQAAERNGGVVTAERPEGGGTLMRLRLLEPLTQ